MAGAGASRAVWIPSAVALVGSIGYFAVSPYQIEKPGKMVQYGTSQQNLTVQHPSNWRPSAFSTHSVVQSVKFEPSQDVHFSIESDLVGSLMADIGKSFDNSMSGAMGLGGDFGGQSSEPSEQSSEQSSEPSEQGEETTSQTTRRSPVEKVHEMRSVLLKEEYEEFKLGRTEKTTLGGLEAAESEFTFKGDGPWGSRTISGTHITALTTDKAIYVTYYAPADQMKTMKPVFDSMRSSIRFRGFSPGGPQ